MKTHLVKFAALSMLLLSAGCGEATSSNASTPNTPNSSEQTPTSSKTSNSVIISSPEEQKTYWNETYSNPVTVITTSGSTYNGEVADPSIVRGDDGYFYIVSTNRLMLRSDDACNWEVFNSNVIDVPSWGKEVTGKGYGLWAPDLIPISFKSNNLPWSV